MKQKRLNILLVAAVMVGVLGVTGCGNKAETGNAADDAVAVMANTAIDGEMQTETEIQIGEASLDFPAEAQSIENNTPALPQAFHGMMEVNFSRVQSIIETAKAENEAVLKAESERKEAEARAAEAKAQAEAAISATATPVSSHSTKVRTIPANEDITLEAGIIYLDYSLLEKVNEDRANNGVAALQWSDSLAQYCADRIPVIKYNILNGIWAHEGFTQTENLAYGAVFTSDEANQGWINSEGHHNSRINSGYTMYAAAVYYDDECIIWMEAFE